MKKWKLFAILCTVLALFVTVPAQAAFQDMWAYVYRWKGATNSDGSMVLERITSGVTFDVLAYGADTRETLYVFGSNAYTSLTNPVTTSDFASATVCNDRIAFRVDPTDATYDRYVDVIVVDTSGGYTTVVKGFDKYQHTIVIDERPGIVHQAIAWFTHASSSTATDTGIDFAINTYIMDVRVEVTTADSGITIDVGTADTAAGFRNDVSLTSTGFVTDTGVITGGSTIDYTPATTYGTLLYTAITGSDTVATVGGRSYIGHLVKTSGTDDDLYYTLSSSAVDTAHGYIYVIFMTLR